MPQNNESQTYREINPLSDDLTILKTEHLKSLYEEYSDKAKHYDLVQMSQKIALNSCYGSLGNEYSRYYDLRLATSITMMGQLAIRYIAHKLNKRFNMIMGTENEDYVTYVDTDSNYLNMQPVIEKMIPDASHDEKIQFLADMGKTLQKTIDHEFGLLSQILNGKEQSFHMECEAVADKAFWTGKKRYVLNIVGDSSGKWSHPKKKIMGLELKRSSTPDAVKPMLEQSIELILNGDIDKFRDYIKQCRKDFYAMDPEEIAFPRGVSDMETYDGAGTPHIYKKGTPIAVRAALLYNHQIRVKSLETKYSKITSGSKIKFIYLKKPNIIHEDVIGFLNSIPEEFGIKEYIDYEKQFVKTFLDPVESILSCIGWTLDEQNTLF